MDNKVIEGLYYLKSLYAFDVIVKSVVEIVRIMPMRETLKPDRLETMLKHCAFTEHCIDEQVYALYDLGKEEINLIEEGKV